jgi:hypothetical protein
MLRFYRLLFLLIGILASSKSLALIDAPPPHSLSPNLNGLNISTMVKKDRVKIMLYVVNHESFPVVCDAQYRSGPEKQDVPQITLPSGKADVFKFGYGRNGDKVLLDLICIDPGQKTLTDDFANGDL